MSDSKVNDHSLVYRVFPENVRINSGMYLGSTEEPSVLVRECLDNACDEVIGGYANKVKVDYFRNYFTVTDNGRGLPLFDDLSNNESVLAAVGIYTRLHYGTDSSEEQSSRSGVHGIGVAAVNAVSEQMIIRINVKKQVEEGREVSPQYKGWKGLQITFDRGILSSIKEFNGAMDYSTSVTCFPDPEIYITVKPTPNKMALKLISLGFKDRGIKAKLISQGEEMKPWNFEELYPSSCIFDSPIKFEVDITEFAKAIVEVNWSASDYSVASTGSCNGVPATQGIHTTASISGIANALVKSPLSKSDTRTGMKVFTRVISSGHVKYGSQTKNELVQIEGTNRNQISRAITSKFLEIIPNTKLEVVRKYLTAYKQITGKMETIDLINEELSTEGKVSLGGEAAKVYDCKNHGPESELYLVEGLSAAGGLLNTRDKNIHAVLPLRGKIINAEKAGMDRSIMNKEIKALFQILGCGIDEVNFKMERLRYGKICVVTDADPDGMAISALIVGVFTAFAPKIIEEGRLTAIETPLYKQDGKYIFEEEDLNKRKTFKRFKGIGALSNDDIKNVVFGKERKIITPTLEKDNSLSLTSLLIASPAPKKKLMQDVGLLSVDAFEFPYDESE